MDGDSQLDASDLVRMSRTSLSVSALVPGAVPSLPSPPPLVMDARAAQTPTRETDLYAWLLYQANQLRFHKPNSIDWGELAEELDEIVALARKETVSRLRTLLAHLLKWKYQTQARNERSWRSTIVEQRQELRLLLEDSRNLQNYLVEKGYAKAYELARETAADQMQLGRSNHPFPDPCEWDADTALNPDFFPASPDLSHSR